MNLGQLLNRYLFSISGHQLVRKADLAALMKRRSEAFNKHRAREKAFQDSVKAFNLEFADRLSRLEVSLAQLSAHLVEVNVEQQSFLKLARLLSPYQVIDHCKTRLGRDHDGGYVLLDDFERIEAAYSFGVGNDSSFDIALAERGIRTFQFDHTIDGPPATHPNLSFFKRRIVKSAEEDGETIGGLLHRYGDGADGKLLLKMDIEGDEWPVLEQVEAKHLRNFAQVICEFHCFEQATTQGWYSRAMRVLEKLATDFAVIHVHGNNVLPFILIGNVPFPPIIEVTFANRACYRFSGSEEIFPTPIDQPNIPDRPDLFLGRFMF